MRNEPRNHRQSPTTTPDERRQAERALAEQEEREAIEEHNRLIGEPLERLLNRKGDWSAASRVFGLGPGILREIMALRRRDKRKGGDK